MIRTQSATPSAPPDYGWDPGIFPWIFCWQVCSFSPCIAPWINTFDNDVTGGPINNNDAASWVTWYGLGTVSWDPNTDRYGNPNSGSIKISIPYTGVANEQCAVLGTFAGRWGYDGALVLNGNNFTSLGTSVSYDYIVSSNSYVSTRGTDYGPLELDFVYPGWSGSGIYEIGSTTMPLTATNWTHVTYTIPEGEVASLNSVAGLSFHQWSSGLMTNNLTLWIDNIVMLPAEEQMHVFIVPDGSTPIYTENGITTNLPYGWDDPSIDWNSYSCMFLRVEQEYFANPIDPSSYYPGYICRWTFKTNDPGDQSQMFNAVNGTNPPLGQIAIFSNLTILGKWCIEFTNPTCGQIIAPGAGGTVVPFCLPPDVAAWFVSNNIALYLGTQPNSMQNISNGVDWTDVLTVNRAWFTNFYESFQDYCWGAGFFDTNHWTKNCASFPAALLGLPCLVPVVWGLSWTVPDAGFGLQAGTDVGNTNSWISLTNETALAIQPTVAKIVPIDMNALNAEFATNSKGPPSNKLYLRLKSPYP
jgi:hypothetical protein